MTTSNAANDENFVKMMAFSFQWLFRSILVTVSVIFYLNIVNPRYSTVQNNGMLDIIIYHYQIQCKDLNSLIEPHTTRSGPRLNIRKDVFP